MNPQVSVVIPTHNRKNIVNDAIDSVLKQEPINYEVIVVDDGSTDGTKEYLESLDLPIRIVQKENAGVASARNEGIRTATGKYIAFLDSDDLWLPGILEAQIEYLDTHSDVPLVYVDQYIESHGTMLDNTRFDASNTSFEQKEKFDLPGFITNQAPIHASAVMVRKSVFDEVGLFDESLKIHEDTDMWNRISEKYKMGFIEKPLSIFRWEKEPEHLLKPELRELFISEGRKYMNLYESRRKGLGVTPREENAIAESYRLIDESEKLIKLLQEGLINEEEFERRKNLLF